MRKKIIIFWLFLFVGIFSLLRVTVVLAVDQTNAEYELPYPGLLPDNFLYPLKAFRDRVVSFFISDPQKKAQFDLLQADKRLAAGEYLLKEKQLNSNLISQIVSKGENYFADAITQISLAGQQGQVTNDFLSKLQNASIKHQQILKTMASRSNDGLRQTLLSDIDRMQEFSQQVKKLMPQ